MLPWRRGELAIRIVRSLVAPRYSGTLPLGEAMIDTRAGTGVLATIYIDRIEWLAHQAGVDARALLGRAIAHELGHLLMATTTHGPVGSDARTLVTGGSAPRSTTRLELRADRPRRDATARGSARTRRASHLGHALTQRSLVLSPWCLVRSWSMSVGP